MATRSSLISEHEVPQEDIMNPAFVPNSLVMGRYERYTPGHVEITPEWFPNDGYVNTISQDGPKIGRDESNIKEYDGTAVPGTWNHMGTLIASDHEDVIGRFTTEEMGGDIVQWYVDHFEILRDLQPITAENVEVQ